MEAAGVAAGRIAVAGYGFGRERSAGARTLLVDATADIDAKSSPKCKAASRTILGAPHTRVAVIDRLGERSRHPAARLRIKLLTLE